MPKISLLLKLARTLPSLFGRNTQRGAGLAEYGMILGLVILASIGALAATGGKVSDITCQAANGLRLITGKDALDCTDIGVNPPRVIGKTTPGVDKHGFTDLYLGLAEVSERHVLLSVDNFDITGLNEIVINTDREDSVSACYQLSGGAITCGSMQGFDSAFYFPPNVVAVGYKIEPVSDPRIEMSQAISITLASETNPELNKTWNIHAYRKAVANIFSPDMLFSDIEFPTGTIDLQSVMVPLKGEFGAEDLFFEVEPADGEFGACAKDSAKSDIDCQDAQNAGTAVQIPSDGNALGYNVFLPRDVRIPVSWPARLTLSSTYAYNDQQSWDITISRAPGEAPAFPDLPFADVEVPADTAGWAYETLELDPEYPSDLLIRMPQTSDSLKACLQEIPQGGYSCSENATTGDLEFVVPAGSYAIGFGAEMPQDVLSDYSQDVAFQITSIDYPDFGQEVALTVTRPAFIVVFAPEMPFGDVTYPMGTTGWQNELLPVEGEFNSDQVLVLPAPQPNVRVCVQETAQGGIACSLPAEDAEVRQEVPLGSYAAGFSVNLGDSEFQPVDENITFDYRSAKDPSHTQTYDLTATRVAVPVEFEPDMDAMSFPDVEYDEATIGWQAAELTPLAGNFNTDLLLSMAAGTADAAVCYQQNAGIDPVCSESAIGTNASLRVPNDAYAIGYRVNLAEDIHIPQELSIAFALSSWETDTYSAPFDAQVTRPEVPVRFDPNLGFRNKTFSAGTAGDNEVLVPIEGEITTGLRVLIPQTDYAIRACYQETSESAPTCSIDAQNEAVDFNVPANSASVGFRVSLPQDIYVEWSKDVIFEVVSDYDETLDYDVGITVSREVTQVAFVPGMSFPNKVFAAGTTDVQSVIEELSGNITTPAQVVIAASGYEIAPCYSASSDSNPSCASTTLASDRSIDADLGSYGVGYQVKLPDDIHQSVDWDMTMQVRSSYDTSLGETYPVTITRPAVPVTWEPNASMALPNANYPVRTTGTKDEMVRVAGEFTTDTDFTIFATGFPLSPCYQATAESQITCGVSTEDDDVTVTFEANAYAIGYRVDLPTDMVEDVDLRVRAELRSAYQPSLMQSQTFDVYRESSPVEFEPTTVFANHTYPEGQVGWQQVMEPLSGNVTTNLELFAEAGTALKLCAQDVEGGDIRCTTGAAASPKTLDVAPDVYAIGYAVELPADPWPADTQTVSFELRMVDHTSKSKAYSLTTNRPALDMMFSASTEFSDVALPEGLKGWFTFTRPLEGDFSTDLQLVAANPGEDFRLCVRAEAMGEVSCQDTSTSDTLPIDASSAEIGYAVDVSDREYIEYTRVATFSLQPVSAPAAGKAFSPTVTRTGREVEMPPSNLFSAHTFDEGATGEQSVMATLDGAGNTPMTISIARSGIDASLCIRQEAAGEMTCSPSSKTEAQSFAISAETYEVGYRVTLPQDPFETYSKIINLSIVSDENPEEQRDYRVSLNRPVKTPIMPASDFFADITYAPGTTGSPLVMEVLDPEIDTTLEFTKQSNQTDVEICYQNGKTSPVTCVGGDSYKSVTITDTENSWYAIGYRFPLDEDEDAEVARTLKLNVRSTDVASVSVPYSIDIVRLSMNAVMPDRTFFADKVFAGEETGVQRALTRIGSDVNIELMLHKAAGQPDIDICLQQSEGATPSCSGSGNADAFSIDVPLGTYAIGYRLNTGDSKFESFEDTLDLSITARDGWSNKVDYSIDVSRPAINMVMPADGLFADIEYEQGTTNPEPVMVLLDPSINTPLSLGKSAGQQFLQICRQATETADIDCYAYNVASETSVTVPVGYYAVGYKITMPSSEFAALDETVSLFMQSRDDVEARTDYSFQVTRPGVPVDLPPEGIFADEYVYAAGTTTTEEVYADIEGTLNANATLSVSFTGDKTTYVCRTAADDTSYCGDRYGKTVYISDKEIGFSVNFAGSEFEEIDETLTLTLTSSADATQSVSYQTRIYRPATEVTLPAQDIFEDEYVFAAGLTSTERVFANIEGTLNANATLTSSATNEKSSWTCRTAPDGTDYCGTKYAHTSYVTDKRVGFMVNFSEVGIYEDYDEVITLTMTSSVDASQSVSYQVRIRRPAVEPTLPEEGMFAEEYTYPAGTTGYKEEFVNIEGMLNANADWAQSITGDQTSNVCRVGSNDKMTCGASSITLSASDKKMGFRTYMPTDIYTEYDETITLTMTSLVDSEETRTYTARIYRPAMEVTMPPADLFPEEIVIAEGDTDVQTITRALDGAINASVSLSVSHTGSTSIQTCKQTNSSNATCGRYGTSAGVDDYGLGFQVWLPNTIYQDYEDMVTFTITSNVGDKPSVSYDIHIVRPGIVASLPPQDLFPEEITIAEGTTELAYETRDMWDYFDAGGKITTSTDGSNSVQPCIGTGGNNFSCNGTSINLSSYYRQGGFRIFLPANVYTEVDQNVTVTATSLADPSRSISYNIRVRRPAVEVTMPSSDLFDAEVTFPEGTTGTKYVLENIAQYINKSARLTTTTDGSYLVKPCKAQAEGSTKYCYSYEDVDQTYRYGGFSIDLPASIYVEVDQTVTLTVASTVGDKPEQTYTVRVRRPAKPVALPPQDLFPEEIVFAASDSGWQYVMEEINSYMDEGAYNSVSTDGPLGVTQCIGSGSRNYCPTSTAIGGYYSKGGFRISLPAPGTEVDQIVTHVVKAAVNQTQNTTYTIRIRRPAE